jgi:hypothetical protein
MYLAAVVATLAAGLFAGAALYVTAVEHPARVQCGPALAVTEFRPSYKRAAVMQASLAVVGMLASILVWFTAGSAMWLAWGLAIGAQIPFTLVVIMPTNKRLLDPSLDLSDASALLTRWGWLHAVRTAVGCMAFVGCLVALADYGG